MDKIIDPLICNWDTASYLIFSGNVFGDFIYYSHLFPAISVLILASILLIQNPRELANRSLFVIAIIFSCWSFIDLVLWATERTDFTMFFWSILIFFDLGLYIASFYFIYTLLKGTMPPWFVDGIFFLLCLPLFLLAHTKLNLVAFDFTNCYREALEGPLWQYYVYPVEALIAITILIMGLSIALKKSTTRSRIEATLAVFGTFLFLLMFSAGNIAGSLEIDWELGQYGLFGMPIMVAILSYLVVKYQTFRANVMSTEALVAAIAVLLLSLLFIKEVVNIRIVTGLTLVMFLILGVLLIRSVRKEIIQREEIQKLAANLERANQRLKQLDTLKSEFVSIASHQLRSPLAAMMGYASMLRDGSYGKLPVKAQEAATRIEESTRLMAQSVEDYLNVSRIEAGHMKYNLTDFSLIEQAEHITDDMRPIGLKKGVVTLFRTSVASKGLVHADKGKTEQIIHNLINNSLKYTPQGTITVIVRDDIQKKRVYLDVLDTGIGMNQQTLHSIFTKFERGSNANTTNIHGTGLGLFTALKLAEAMGGTITARSEGEGKGSCFSFELPLVG
ncbi:HAMP domain-containing histidine kinase [Patescibacteria group bacterium]|nr:HAMP domain-containing histidine kinase [Patescibacteria group bacterium]